MGAAACGPCQSDACRCAEGVCCINSHDTEVIQQPVRAHPSSRRPPDEEDDDQNSQLPKFEAGEEAQRIPSSRSVLEVTTSSHGLKMTLSPVGVQGRQADASSTLVYVERNVRSTNSWASSADSTREGAGGAESEGGGSSHRSSRRCKAMAVLPVANVLAVPPSKLDPKELERFRSQLQAAGLDLSKFGVRGAKSVEHLFWEVSQQRGCLIAGLGSGQLKRVTRLVKIRLIAEIFGVVHTLYSRMQFMHDGQTIERRQVPLRRLLWKPGSSEALASGLDASVYAEMCPHTEDWQEGCRKALTERLGLTQTWQKQHLVEEEDAYTYHTEDDVTSSGYPGLNTLYCIYGVTYRVLHPEHPNVQCIGLPEGQEFATTEGEFNFNKGILTDQLSIGTQLNIWTWDRADPPAKPGETMTKAASTSSTRVVRGATMKLEAQDTARRLIRRAPLPNSTTTLVVGMQARLATRDRRNHSMSTGTLSCAMRGLETDWACVKKVAKRIADPRYSLKEFNEDLQAFPELSLYLLHEATTSGNSIGDEYQRTIGAFFAIYWLMRLSVDGREGFTFGVDGAWAPPRTTAIAGMTIEGKESRRKFYDSNIWPRIRKLFVDAGLLKEEWRMFSRQPTYAVNQKRLVSLLALTAVHDIMKMSILLPEVVEQHAPYKGFQAGDTISDHDVALSYIMERYPELLPSFHALDADEKRSVQFTQCNLCFNYGWFVQAEAPPGATFSQFRETLIRDHKSQLSQQDVALYFVHWLTDLAGAEPTPLGGAEKFTLKFPLPVLNSFLRSFEFVQRITDRTETEIMEEYLQVRWAEHEPSLGPTPTGVTSIAKMRLMCQAQANAAAILRGFDQLDDEDRDILCVEMSRTGTLCQTYSSHLIPECVRQSPAGPAILVYYAPAFLQRPLEDEAMAPVERLQVLAELYRRVRELWPENVAKAAQNVTLRIDMIKSLSRQGMWEAMKHPGDVWIVLKHNEHEAFVELCSRRKLNKLIATRVNMQILELGTLATM